MESIPLISKDRLSDDCELPELPAPNQSAFRQHQSTLNTWRVQAHHEELWKVIGPGLKTGRTYCYAECCATFYDGRRVAGSEVSRYHTAVKTMFKVLGKRTFESLEDFSQKIGEQERKIKPPFDRIALNRNHEVTQLTIKVYSHEQDIKNLFEKIKSLEFEVDELKKARIELTEKLQTEVVAKNKIVEISRNLSRERCCQACNTQKICPTCQE